MGPAHDRAGLRRAWAANRPGSTEPHAVVVLPSYSLSQATIGHYAGQLHAYEHRYLVTALMLGRIATCEWIFVSSQEPDPAVIDYYVDLLPEVARDGVRERLHVVSVRDDSTRPVAAKLLEDPGAIHQVEAAVGRRPALIEPWNVTAVEVQVAERLGVPVNGTAPELEPLGFKSAARRILVEAGVPVPLGREDVRAVDELLGAARWVAQERAGAPAVVVKHDDSVSGVGNAVLPLRGEDGRLDEAVLRAAWGALPEGYRTALGSGGVVEELLTGQVLTSPSVQADITPDGEVVVLSTHEQVLGGADRQVYEGCSFPARAEYASVIARQAAAVGQVLAARGALGRFGVDFVAVRRDGEWAVHGIEINLRRGGTTHPFTVLRHLVPGRYDLDRGRWVAEDGSSRVYRSTDHLQDEAWRGLTSRQVIDAVGAAGLHFDPVTGTGVVLHMLSGLALDGWLGLTAIARTGEDADAMVARSRRAIDSCTAGAA